MARPLLKRIEQLERGRSHRRGPDLSHLSAEQLAIIAMLRFLGAGHDRGELDEICDRGGPDESQPDRGM
jgi:hypothetical protein